MTEKAIMKLLSTFARTISHQSFGLISHIPEPDSIVNACYKNADLKVERDGGSVQYGWVFAHRLTAAFESVGYFIATHHSVWRDPNKRLIDVTPFNSEVKHQPLNVDGKVYFLTDDKAEPVQVEGIGAPLPMRFFPLNNGKKLQAYLEELRVKEEIACQQYYNEIADQVIKGQSIETFIVQHFEHLIRYVGHRAHVVPPRKVFIGLQIGFVAPVSRR